MKKEFSFSVPIYINIGKSKKKNHYINMNSARNWPFHLSNNLKKKFKAAIEDRLPTEICYSKYRLEYVIYLPNKLKRDIMNIGSMIDKFTNDALVELGIVEEDNYNHLQDVRFSYGGYDEEKEGYVIVTVIELDNLKET